MSLDTLWIVSEVLLALVLLFGVTIVGACYYLEPSFRRNFRYAKDFPQIKGLPVFGNVLQFIKPRGELFPILRSLREALGGIYVIRIFFMTFYHISDPDAVEAVLSSTKHITKGKAYDFLRPWLGEGLLTSGGKVWHSRRKLLTPAFHFRILEQFSEHLEHHAARLTSELEEERRKAGGASIDVTPIISRVTLRAIMVTAMGKVDFQTNGNCPGLLNENSYFEAVHRVGNAFIERFIRPWLWVYPIFKLTALYKVFREDLKTLHDFTSKVIAERKEIVRQHGKDLDSGEGMHTIPEDSAPELRGRKKARLQPFLDVLLTAQREGAAISDNDIREEVDTFMFEGHDTTSVALGWALELLGRHPDVQDRLAAELKEAGSDWESVSKLPYLDRVLKECLRLRPSVPFISRYLGDDAVLPDGKIIPANAVCNIIIYHLHRHPDHFPDPERFDPDRFLPELEQSRHPFAYVPFSAGPRNCIGKRFALMEVKLLLAAVVRQFLVRSAVAHQGDEMIIADIVLRPSSGVRLQLT